MIACTDAWMRGMQRCYSVWSIDRSGSLFGRCEDLSVGSDLCAHAEPRAQARAAIEVRPLLAALRRTERGRVAMIIIPYLTTFAVASPDCIADSAVGMHMWDVFLGCLSHSSAVPRLAWLHTRLTSPTHATACMCRGD